MEAKRLVAGLSPGRVLIGLAVVFVIQVAIDKVRKNDATKSEDAEEDEE